MSGWWISWWELQWVAISVGVEKRGPSTTKERLPASEREREREREQLRARGSREDIWRAQREDEDDEQKLQRGKIASVEIRKTKARLEPLCDYHSKKRMRSNDNNERKREGRWVGLKGERSEEEEEEEQKKVWMGGRA